MQCHPLRCCIATPLFSSAILLLARAENLQVLGGHCHSLFFPWSFHVAPIPSLQFPVPCTSQTDLLMLLPRQRSCSQPANENWALPRLCHPLIHLQAHLFSGPPTYSLQQVVLPPELVAFKVICTFPCCSFLSLSLSPLLLCVCTFLPAAGVLSAPKKKGLGLVSLFVCLCLRMLCAQWMDGDQSEVEGFMPNESVERGIHGLFIATFFRV